MKKHLLWLDDNYNDFGEIVNDYDLELMFDRSIIQRSLPDAAIEGVTTYQRFLQKLIDHIRMREGIKTKSDNPYIIDAIVLDIMIARTPFLELPKLNEASHVIFSSSGDVCEWEKYKTIGEGFNAGMVIAEHFILKEPSLRKIPLMLYTQRPIDHSINTWAENAGKDSLLLCCETKTTGVGKVADWLKSAMQ